MLQEATIGTVRICENQISAAGHLLTIFDMSPSTTTKGAERFYITFNPYTIMGPSLGSKKTSIQKESCQPALTPHWDVNRCQDRLTLYYCMLDHPPQPVRDPVRPEQHSDNQQSHVYIVVNKNS